MRKQRKVPAGPRQRSAVPVFHVLESVAEDLNDLARTIFRSIYGSRGPRARVVRGWIVKLESMKRDLGPR